MAKMFGVFHLYGVDGGFGDAISREDLLFVTADGEKAQKYVDKWSRPHVYSSPYNDLYRGELVVKPLDSLDDVDFDKPPFYWYDEKDYYDKDYYSDDYEDEEEIEEDQFQFS